MSVDVATGGGVSAGVRSGTAEAEPDAISVAIIEGREGFMALQQEWDGLFEWAAAPQQVFQSHVFLRHWATHYHEGGSRIVILTARLRGELAMVWPLVMQRRFGLTILRFMGVPVAQFGDVLVARGRNEARLLAAGWRALKALKADLFELRMLRADSALAASLPVRDSLMLERRQAPFADLDLRVGPDGPSAFYPARERSNHRRRLRRLEEHGPVSFAQVHPGPEAAELATAAVAMKLKSLERQGIVAPTVADPRFAALFRDLAGDADGGSPLRITVVSCAGRAAAIDLSLDCGDTTFGHVLASHPDHERGGLGSILIQRSFAAARARGSARFDLLAPADPYKLAHADGVTEVSDTMLPLSLKGQLACGLGLRHLRPALRLAARNLPPPVTRRLIAWSCSGKG